MATAPSSSQTAFHARLRALEPSAAVVAGAAIPPLLVPAHDDAAALQFSDSGRWLLQVLDALDALHQASQATRLSADALRRDQKFAPPGRPSLHLVQLRQQQAAAQQAVRRANQTLAQAAAGFVRSAGLTPPPRTGPVAFVQGWLARHLG
ncbi:MULTISPECIES: hypothetical protein [Xanthomonas]|uniref:Uncharacterized protein n=1 Tax=Xanthomonas sacchari TaxID=56458 RepID=A0ABT3DZ70_9XANT|nr:MULTISPECIES: hypothetical protein [Xanthomonas]KAB7765589.1 hypothetical protein CEK68_11375 [Xanthomonas sp. LMG 12461]MCW0400790.1 hypothetical protein [Xanthomonas sacchari]MCW0421511.1 hypothetical protein [Xanthomonas sacchari]UYK74072.1 hypothetical protein NG828_07085 [Xanthomonas sacchari]